MRKTTNSLGREVYEEVTEDSPFSPELFHEVDMTLLPDDFQWALHTNLGSLTVLDRLTGYGNGDIRDTETGFRAPNRDFWLASGMQDVRHSGAKTIGEAIAWVKRNANTCIPDPQQQLDL